MAQTIQIRRGTGSAVPSSLAAGELAINLDSGKLFYGNGSAVSSNFRVDSITAENYTVSSSVTSYTFQSFSGSTDFGDDSGDIHKRTGSLNVSGALNVDGDIAGTLATAAQTNITSVGTLGSLTVTGNITANGNIVGDGSTNITSVDTISGDGTITMSDVTIDGTLNNGVPLLSFTSSGYSPVGGIAYAGGTDAGNRYALMFAGLNENLVSLCNRQHNGRVDIRANSSTAGAAGEVTASLFTHNSVQLLLPVTASGNISSSGDIIANRATFDGNISASHAYFGGSVDVVGNIEANSSGTTLKGNIFLGTKDGSDAVYIARYQGTSTAYPYAHIFAGHSDYNEKVGFKISVRNNSGTLQDGIIIDGNTREVTFANVVNCTALNTGQGDNELYAMNQDVETSDNVQFNQITTTGDISMSGGDLYVADDIFMKSDNAVIFMGDSGNEYTLGIANSSFIINAGITNPASVNHFIVSASGGTATEHARIGIGASPHPSDTLNVTGSIRAEGANIGGDITCQDIAINGGNITTAVEVDGLLTAGADMRVGGAGSTSNNWITIDCQNGSDTTAGGICFYETGTDTIGAPQYGAKIVYNEDDDEFAIGTMDNNTFKRQIYMKRNQDYVYLADAVFAEGTTPGFILSDTSTTVADGDNIGNIGWRNEDDDSYTLNIKGIATEDHASGANGGSKLEIQVTPNGTSTLATAVTIDQDKSLNTEGNISASGAITANSLIETSRTRIKILPRDFVADDIGRPLMIENDNLTSSDEAFLTSFGGNPLYAFVEIPTGYTATHAKISGSDTGQAYKVYEGNIGSKDMTSKSSGTAINTEANITDVAATDTNYLFIEVTTDGVDDEIFGGYVTITPS